MAELIEALADLVGAEHVVAGADISEDYSHDESLHAA